MNIQETIALIEALRASGVVKFKSHEHEIELSSNAVIAPKKAIPQEQSEDQTKATAVATEKIKGLINTMAMSPEELANQIFPDGAL